jgi:SNF2 family DNA or RNA helicase
MDQTKKQIEELYQSFTSPQDLKEMEQDERLVSKLFKYQRQALHWMYHHEQFDSSGDEFLFWKKNGLGWKNQITDTLVFTKPRRERGGILADDMGLGKTIQIISLILKSKPLPPSERQINPPLSTIPTKPDPFGFVPKGESVNKKSVDPRIGSVLSNSTLIVCPLSLIHNWEDQILTHTKKNALSILVYHGPNRSNDPEYIQSHDIVITTYNIIGVGLGKNIISPLHRIHWLRIVLDEAHIIKSATTIQSRAAFSFKGDIKWCLTGTPVQNKLDDLYSLVKFIQIEPLDRKADWAGYITKPISQSKSTSAFRKLQTLMRGIALRRIKTDLIDGKPIVSLPPREERVIMLELNPSERVLYDRIHTRGKKIFEAIRVQGSIVFSYAKILKAILLMRQACLHPNLVKFDEDTLTEGNYFLILEVNIDIYKKLSSEEVISMFNLLRQNEEDFCIFCNSTVDGPGNYMSPCKHLYLKL